ncbi:16S rRNA (guanine(527)-N(7))-methyltransferase RsmG [Salinivibrio sp. MA351]|jgi:16S rRNA m(7)G-527 methyltransferase (EC 2.1.1.-)|uniref:16S rRNA (guanine(527)-N(7))-methyltransferase RsmG n=1 Tax=Salinivibrio TaxID=51366 RepID=UPI0009892C23|nr:MULTISPECIES: 16S rRNA (guanine(527)-N(7))-methyltransferase RsmG [unclassified Salinivibrio]OOE96660.1 16S rRNA (guanine(527)-N(7))-methyltransferase RsmG [Salinivibrio sp. IB643]OOE97565.1 16S rRNA (guanine(527)-N(7))-methyltransferase RsmG [Salinivibrio sp. MA351]OOF04273.1 16S rRNA (guanine(527)-N(7))-methyltransferase RsmG [Salinivibrio sp. MA607]
MEQQLEYGLAQAGLVLSAQQQQQLLDYVRLLHKWNKAYNLTSVRHPDDMVVKHILDSLVVSPHLKGQQFIDVGTGPGLPGIPLAIANPDKQFTLLDSLGKRIRFIRQVLHELGLTNVTPVQSRVEDFTPEHGFDAVLSRAFASMSDMVSWCHHLPHAQGCFYALKGQVDQQEIDALPADCSVTDIKALKVPGLEGARHLVILRAKSNE